MRLSRPRVAMFYSATFGRTWADAASEVADVIRIETSREPRGPGLADFPDLALIDEGAHRYRLRVPPEPPRRLLGPLADYPSYRRHVAALRHLAEVHGPIDLLHAHFYAQARHFPWINRRLGIPYVVTEHSSSITGTSPDARISARGVRIARSVYRHASLVIVVSRSLRKAIERLGMDGRFVVIPNPVDTAVFRPRNEGGTGEDLRLVSVGRLERVKGHDVLLEAIARVRDGNPNLSLSIVGTGSQESELLSRCRALDLEDVVDFIPYLGQQQVASILRASDVFVLASRAENLPISIIEALCTGLPVIATDVGGNSELVGREFGVLVQPDDPSALASVLEQELPEARGVDHDTRARMAAERYSLAAVGSRLGSVYGDVLAMSDCRTTAA